MGTLSERLEFLIKEHLKTNVGAFSVQIGESQQRVEYLLNKRDANPQADLLIGIANRYHDINIGWLLTGRGEMLIRNLVFTDGTGAESDQVYRTEPTALKDCRQEVEALNTEINELLRENRQLNKEIRLLKNK